MQKFKSQTDGKIYELIKNKPITGRRANRLRQMAKLQGIPQEQVETKLSGEGGTLKLCASASCDIQSFKTDMELEAKMQELQLVPVNTTNEDRVKKSELIKIIKEEVETVITESPDSCGPAGCAIPAPSASYLIRALQSEIKDTKEFIRKEKEDPSPPDPDDIELGRPPLLVQLQNRLKKSQQELRLLLAKEAKKNNIKENKMKKSELTRIIKEEVTRVLQEREVPILSTLAKIGNLQAADEFANYLRKTNLDTSRGFVNHYFKKGTPPEVLSKAKQYIEAGSENENQFVDYLNSKGMSVEVKVYTANDLVRVSPAPARQEVAPSQNNQRPVATAVGLEKGAQ
jgi:hypothetical protein